MTRSHDFLMKRITSYSRKHTVRRRGRERYMHGDMIGNCLEEIQELRRWEFSMEDGIGTGDLHERRLYESMAQHPLGVTGHFTYLFTSP